MNAALILSVVIAGLQGEAQDPPAVQDLERELLEKIAEAGIEFDREAKTATIPALVNRLGDPLEYALIHRKGKTHEALLLTEVQPSLMNAALLALGLEPGVNATYKEKDPPPTREEVEAGADWVDVFPPEGMPLYMTVSWTTETEEGEEEEHEVAIEDLILDMTTGRTVDAMQWIFLGGRMAALYRGDPPVFVADYEGNMVSICYLDPPNHLATMKHERARDDMIWWRTDRCPAPGVEVKVTFHRNKPKAVEEREKRLEGRLSYEALVDEYVVAHKQYLADSRAVYETEEYKKAQSDGDVDKVRELSTKYTRPGPAFVPRFSALAGEHEGTDVEADCLLWIVMNGGRSAEEAQRAAVQGLVSRHIDGEAMWATMVNWFRVTSIGDDLMKAAMTVIETSRNPEAVAEAHWYRKRMAPGDTSEIDQLILEQFPDSTPALRLRGPAFKKERLQDGMVAPDITGWDIDGVEFSLSDYRGKVVLLDFWGDW